MAWYPTLPSFASISCRKWPPPHGCSNPRPVTECRLAGISAQQTVPMFLPFRIRDPEMTNCTDRAQYCNGAGVDLTRSDGDLGMLFKGAAQTAFSVFLAGGLVVDVTSDKRKAPGIRPFTLGWQSRTHPSELTCQSIRAGGHPCRINRPDTAI